MTFSGSRSPTFTESNSRNAIVEATLFSLFSGTARQSRIGLLHHVTRMVGDDVLGHDDVGAERLPYRMDVDIAVEPIAGDDRLHELEFLVDLDDLRVLDADIGAGEERRLRLVPENRDEGQRAQQTRIAEVRGGRLIEERGVIVLDGGRVLADLLPAHDVVVGVAIVHPDDVL